MDELERIFETRKLTESTKKTYRQTFNKIHSLVGANGVPLHTFTYDNIMFVLDQDPKLSESYKNKIICLFLIIKEYYDSTDPSIAKLRLKVHDVADKIADKRVQDFQNENTDQYDAIESWIQELTDPQQYITNYILFYLNTRNLDLIAKVIHDIDYDTTLDNSINYLVVYPDHVVFIRNIYKTKGTYGQKINTISDNKFLNFIKRIKNDTFILNNNTHTIDRMIQLRTYKNMTETEYLHNVIQKFNGNADKLFEIERNRGSNLRYLLTNYNADFKNL